MSGNPNKRRGCVGDDAPTYYRRRRALALPLAQKSIVYLINPTSNHNTIQDVIDRDEHASMILDMAGQIKKEEQNHDEQHGQAD